MLVIRMDQRSIKETLADLGVFPDRKLGQTFLADEAVAEREALSTDITKNDVVLEIGPGLGILTSRLCALAGRVIAVEKDRRLSRYLTETLALDNLEVITGDALEIELPLFDIAAGNLPYSVSSPILFRLSEHGMGRGIFMIQKEVAERVVAVPFTAEYSRMSASLQRLYETIYLFDVGHSHFYPSPDVDSAVVRLLRRENAKPWPEFDSVVTLLFSQRRKTINAILRKSVAGYQSLQERVPFGDRRIEELTNREMEKLVSWIIEKGLSIPARN